MSQLFASLKFFSIVESKDLSKSVKIQFEMFLLKTFFFIKTGQKDDITTLMGL